MQSLLHRHSQAITEKGGPDFAFGYFSRLVDELATPAFTCPGGEVLAVAISADARLVATGSKDGAVRLWDAKTHKALATLARHDGAVTSLRFLPSDKALASCGTDGAVRVWDPWTHQELAKPFRPGLEKGTVSTAGPCDSPWPRRGASWRSRGRMGRSSRCGIGSRANGVIRSPVEVRSRCWPSLRTQAPSP